MFRKLFGLRTPKKDEFKAALPDALRQSILHSLGLKSVPVMPAAAQQAFKIATNPNAEALDFVEVLEADEGLSARVLKIANSVFYDRGGGSRTIVEAVSVIGISELKNLLNATVLANLFPVKHPLRVQLWSHNIATALTAQIVARHVSRDSTDQAFLGGLMHDVGKLLILQQHTDSYDRIVRKGLSDGIESIAAEVRAYPFDHTHVGQLVAERWNFTSDLHDVLANHHRPWGDIEAGSLTGLIKASDIAVHAIGLGAGRDSGANRTIYAPLLDEAWSFLRIPLKEQKALLQEASLAFDSEYQTYESWGRS